MKKTTTTSAQFIFSSIIKSILILVIMHFTGLISSLYGQCSLTCNSNVQISLDQNCYAEVTPDDILEGSWDISCEPFTVVVSGTGTNYVTGNQLGQTVSVTIYAATGNSCTGTILVSEYLAPVINCQPSTISCFDDPATVSPPTVTDNCDGDPTLTYTEQVQDLGCNGAFYKIITRTYTATDDSGNTSSCDQIINVTRPSLAQVVFPLHLNDIVLPALDCVNPNTSPSNTGTPTIDGNPITNICDFGTDYSDQIISFCQNSYEILRHWTVYDWCNSTNTSFTQSIKVLDKTPPTLICPSNVTISVNSNDCFGSIIIPNPTVSDNCSSNNNITIDIDSPEGYLNGNTLYNLPLGVHSIFYTATDDCGNSSTCTMLVEVIDEIPPVAVCESYHVVGLNNPGGTLVEAIVFDDGSEDNCSAITYEVRRMDTPHCPGNDGTDFDAFVPFYCCDIGNTVMVELRVTDASGNTNSCMVEATAEDEVSPIISCPPDVSIDCGDDYNDLTLTGQATATDNCNYTITHFDFVDTGNCGDGLVNRSWTATDDSGNSVSCLQKIFLINSTPFYITDTNCNNSNPNDGVIWPCAYDTDACGPGLDPSVTGEPEIIEDFCDLVAVTFSDVYLPISPPACVKVLRTWLIVDWCQYDENTGNGTWEYTQIIKVLNSADPVILSDCSDLSFCSYDENCENGPATLILTANDDCTDSTELNYYYWIDLDNDGSNEIAETGNDASGTYPLGSHKILWHVEDGCGNISECEYLFVIADCKNPTPNLLNGIATEMMENCEIEIWATDWDNTSSPSYDNCGIQEWVMVTPSLGPGQVTPPSNATPSWTFSGSCDIGTQSVDIWILDINGNWAYVSTYVVVEDNLAPFCPGNCLGSASGEITTEISDPVENVAVEISSPDDPNMDYIVSTNTNGQYSFPDLENGLNYIITPEKDINPLNGVSTFDMVLISKHILGLDSLDSPYKMIAADINNSGTISTIDLVQLRRLILYIDDHFQNNTSWRFVDAEFVFPDPENPWQTSFPEIFTINGLSGSEIADFTAIKIGDVNNSAETNDFQNGTDIRSTTVPFIFETVNQLLKKDQTYTIPVYADDLNTMLGFQFSLELDQDAIEVQSIEAGNVESFNIENLGINLLDRGVITGSWYTPNPLEITERAILFTINIVAKKNAPLIKVLKLNSSYTKAEAYDIDFTVMDLVLAFSEEVTATAKLFQNSPNPFIETSTIAFELPESGRTTFSIIDISGKVVFKNENYYEAGYHEIEIDKNNLPTTGLYFYQLQPVNGERIIKKLVLTDRPED
jgi:type IX secretion system substrate protein/HYR domain-containing protein